ncbi:3-oxoacyl-[acyl-carrier-protein] synthase II [Actinokineospora alba]|uniref:3-oxoacyl-[acyl-carrier-protein] synthase II n=1 Tax=Actinokineospora alba TaxID=504798 RepID=A0A1H0M7T3_9PSEU|nr:beta-ketoacyl-[acyl-carrier-protein] synthase family protein [Actinokineospora alba]TDP67617.1 3-oxoacyl-[acyl-carrier-protein] synthase II [Actinokineospora alba]SDI44399.1 3-oxoacyl-[acyl-carrier-protein] synthase II [Actinokineospora alba]SDO76405.1 3-oxoacyl-[acyl-carrier-protein] synthase II [Actinokineospora alba]
MASSTQVSVTGMGVVTPAGCDLDRFWSTVLAGRSTAKPLDHFDLSGHGTRFGCRVDGLDETGLLNRKEARRMDPFARFGLAAALAAHQHAGTPAPDPARTAIVVGTAVGGRWTSDEESRNYFLGGPRQVNPLMPLVTMPNSAAALIAMRLGWLGPSLTVSTTCASGVDAVGLAAAMVRSGQVDVAIAGGCESTLTPVSLAGFANLNAMSTRNDDPGRACRPFDVDRDGFVMGEGAGFVVIERRADADARGARTYADLAGYAATSDAHHLAMPLPDGAGASAAMSAAIADAGLTPADIVHVNAHGTSTPHNDRAEANALAKVFGSRVPPVTATKGVTGHLIGAAGTVELIATILAMAARTVPPTANHERIEPGMDIDLVHGKPRAVASGPALSNSFGFGGHNACLVVTP